MTSPIQFGLTVHTPWWGVASPKTGDATPSPPTRQAGLADLSGPQAK
jgi:hypothetical protein